VEGLGVPLSKGNLRGADLLIFVTVGNAKQGFDRLMQAVDAYKSAFPPGEDIHVQYGHSGIIPSSCIASKFFSREEFDRLIHEASLVITHGGAGSIGKCLMAGKKPVVVPRSRSSNEVVNDHQFELARELESQGRVYAVYDVAFLPEVVWAALARKRMEILPPNGSRVVEIVRDYLDRLSVEEGESR